jgi:hypothetical protein
MGQRIAQAGNTVIPALLALESIGFSVIVAGEHFIARRGTEEYVADDPVALLGLIHLVQIQSWDWAATDAQIDETMRRYDLR